MDKLVDANDEEQIRKRKTDAGRRRAADDAVIRRLLESGEGRSYVWRFLEACHVLAQPFDPNSDRVTSFLLGEMNVGQRLLADVLRAAPEAYLLMAKESKENA